MTAEPQTYAEHTARPGATLGAVGAVAGSPVGAAPPHLLWETLESAFSGSEIDAPVLYGTAAPKDKRLAGYVAMPLALGLSLALWVVIVVLVLTR